MKKRDSARQYIEQQILNIEEKFGIRPNVNSEERYLAYWANLNNNV